MTIRDIIPIVEGKVMCCPHMLDEEIKSACGSDMMSDVLAYVKDQSVLLTGLCNPQVVRTSEMMDMKCIVFVRGKTPDEMILDLATAKDIVIICSDLRLYEACGRLYSKGLGVGE